MRQAAGFRTIRTSAGRCSGIAGASGTFALFRVKQFHVKQTAAARNGARPSGTCWRAVSTAAWASSSPARSWGEATARPGSWRAACADGRPDVPGVGRAMAGGGEAENRQADDFYPTPADVTHALLETEFRGILAEQGVELIWEPACGRGDMVEVLKRLELPVVASDLVDRGYGAGGRNFLTAPRPPGAAPFAVVTNPPFDIAKDFIIHAHAIGAAVVALTLKSTYWHAARRFELWRRCTPVAIFPLTWRPDFLDLKAPTMEIAWCIWTPRDKAPCVFRPLPRPSGGMLL